MLNIFLNQKKREEGVFKEEICLYIDDLYAYALSLCRNPSDAQDLVQETYLKAIRFHSRFKPGTNLRAWLFTILHNTFKNNYRKQKREIVHNLFENETIPEDSEPAFPGIDLDPQGHFFSKIVSDQVQKAFLQISIDFREVILLCDLYDFSYREIAQMLDCPVGTVMSRLFRGRKLLQKILFNYARQNNLRTNSKESVPEMERDSNSGSIIEPEINNWHRKSGSGN